MAPRPNYGIDAPGLVRTFFLVGGVTAVLLLAAAFGFRPGGWWRILPTALLSVVAVYALGMGCLMVFYSRVTKLRDRDRLLDLLALRR